MRLLLTKCFICDNWYSPWRGHCPHCGAVRFHLPASLMNGAARYTHCDIVHPERASQSFVEMVRGVVTTDSLTEKIDSASRALES